MVVRSRGASTKVSLSTSPHGSFACVRIPLNSSFPLFELHLSICSDSHEHLLGSARVFAPLLDASPVCSRLRLRERRGLLFDFFASGAELDRWERRERRILAFSGLHWPRRFVLPAGTLPRFPRFFKFRQAGTQSGVPGLSRKLRRKNRYPPAAIRPRRCDSDPQKQCD